MWFIYGNGGEKCTMLNHKLIQGFVQYNEDRRDAYKDAYKNMKKRFGEEYAKEKSITRECLKVIELILENKFEEAINLSKTKIEEE